MEQYERDHIIKNLPQLIPLTSCTPIFLAILRSVEVLTGEEIDSLTSIGSTQGQHHESDKFYEIVQRKANSYNLLKQALKATSQSGALAILDQVNEFNNGTPFRNYGTITYNKKLVIGRGSNQTKIYKGKFENRDVAVKKLLNEIVDKEKVRQEIDFLTTLDSHINVIRYFTAEITQDFTLIALELCEIDLHDWVTDSHADLEISALDIIKQVTEGIQHLHLHHVIHRDLKPENILLTRPGSRSVLVKIADFGTSKMMKDGLAKMSRNTTGIGTDGWTAPEVVDEVLLENQDDLQNMGFASDIFSLGCIYYFVLTEGEHSFGVNIKRRQFNILEGRTNLNEDKITTVKYVKSGFIALIRKMIAYEFSERPPMSEIIQNGSDLELAENSGATILPLAPPTSKKARYVSYQYRRLEEAIYAKDEGQTKALLFRGQINVNEANYMSETLLHRAAASDDKAFATKIIKALIEKNAKASYKDKDGYTFLHRLVDDGTTLTPEQFHEISVFLITKNLAELFNIPESADQQFRFERFFEIYNSSTPFQMAVKNIEIDRVTLKLLQENKVDFNAVNSRRNSPLFYALMGRRSIQFLSDMVDLGADVKQLNKFNDSLLHYAALYGEVEHLWFFLERGHDIDAKSKAGYTPLSLVVGYRSGFLMDKCRFLIDRGARAGVKNTIGTSPMDFVMSASESDVLDKDELTDLLGGRQ